MGVSSLKIQGRDAPKAGGTPAPLGSGDLARTRANGWKSTKPDFLPNRCPCAAGDSQQDKISEGYRSRQQILQHNRAVTARSKRLFPVAEVSRLKCFEKRGYSEPTQV